MRNEGVGFCVGLFGQSAMPEELIDLGTAYASSQEGGYLVDRRNTLAAPATLRYDYKIVFIAGPGVLKCCKRGWRGRTCREYTASTDA